ncbi:hypothetical protein FPHYL_7215 [Fusarium phyllophilum]|uniref:Uncharacterized protein n=1 Tax=Fusarium phyllophilum TaxID=47803 RepID=A0A8H5JPD6_9HYPO|nr:hypothetical protein FPHYL_7215 [Fusarium phyllophilum]
MMEAHFKAKTTTKLLKFQIYDNFNDAAKVQGELWDLLRKEKVLEEWDVQGLFLMTSLGEVFDSLDGGRLLQCFEMPTMDEFLDRLFPLTAGVSSR